MPLTVTEISTQEAGRLSIMAGGLVQVPLSEIEMPQGQIEPSRAEATPPRCFVRRQGIIPTSLLGIDIPEPILSRSLALCGSHGLHKFCFGQGPVSEVNLGATVAQTSPGIIRSQLACSSIVSQRFVPPLLLHGKIPQPRWALACCGSSAMIFRYSAAACVTCARERYTGPRLLYSVR